MQSRNAGLKVKFASIKEEKIENMVGRESYR